MEAELIIGNKYPEKVVPMLVAASRSIDIIIYEWRLYPSRPTHQVMVFTSAIADAVKRGVAVRVLCASEGLRDDLRRLGIQARSSYTAKLLHAKIIIIDKEKVILGSHNFTQSAFSQNIEVSAALSSPVLLDEVCKYFDNLYGI